MTLGKVIGNLWSTKKDAGLNGLKLLVVEPFNAKTKETGMPIIAADLVGAGNGETVLWVYGSTARYATHDGEATVDAVVVAIVDGIEIGENKS